ARYYFNESERVGARESTAYQRSVVSTGIAISAIVSVMISAPLYFFAQHISRLLFEIDAYGDLFKIVAVALVFRGLTTTPTIYLRVRERAHAYAILAILQIASLVALNVVFVLVFGWGLVGILYGQLWSTIFWSVLCVAFVGHDLMARPRTEV